MELLEIENIFKEVLNFDEVYVCGEGFYYNIIVVSDMFNEMSWVKC